MNAPAWEPEFFGTEKLSNVKLRLHALNDPGNFHSINFAISHYPSGPCVGVRVLGNNWSDRNTADGNFSPVDVRHTGDSKTKQVRKFACGTLRPLHSVSFSLVKPEANSLSNLELLQ